MILFLVLLAVPLIEIALFIKVGGLLGLWPTLLCVAVTALMGTLLLRQQGRAALQALAMSMQQVQDPSKPLAHGALIVLGGVLLLTPGFFTDAIGLSLMVPRVRDWLMVYGASRVAGAGGRVSAGMAAGAREATSGQRAGQHSGGNSEPIIDADFTEIPPEHRPTHRGSTEFTRH